MPVDERPEFRFEASFELPREVVERLREQAAERGTTFEALVQEAFADLLAARIREWSEAEARRLLEGD